MPLACRLPAPVAVALRLAGPVLRLFLQLGFMAHASLCLVLRGVDVGESS
jgi:hypothetical protein